MKRAVVHIGLPKTGTSAIQHALGAAREELLGNGVLYPSMDRQHNVVFHTLFSSRAHEHPMNKFTGITADQIPALRDSYEKTFQKQFNRSGWHTLLLSSESLSNLAPGEVVAFFNWLSAFVQRVRIIVYVRHPIDWTRSAVQQNLKTGQTLESMANRPPVQNIRSHLSPFVRALGTEHVTLCCYEQAMSANGGIIQHFCRKCEIPDNLAGLLSMHQKHINRSMSAQAALLLDDLNKHSRELYQKEFRKERARALRRILAEPGSKFELSAEQMEFVRQNSVVDIRWLQEIFGVSWYEDIRCETTSRVV